MEEHIEDPAATAPELKKAIALADQILVEMRQVLDRMLELETYNEVVSLLRDIITDQDQINRRTKEQQKERLEGLFQRTEPSRIWSHAKATANKTQDDPMLHSSSRIGQLAQGLGALRLCVIALFVIMLVFVLTAPGRPEPASRNRR